MRHTVIAFGELLWDLLPDGVVLGGAPFNCAYRLSSLGDRAVTVSRLGRDELGRKAVEQVTSLGLETSCIQWDDAYPTGTVQVTLDHERRPDFHIIPDVAYDRIELTDDLLQLAREADGVCFGTLAQRADHSRRSLYALLQAARKALKFLDINLRRDCYSVVTVANSLQSADVLKLNEDEILELGRMFDLRVSELAALSRCLLRRWDLQCVVVTLGEKGALAVSRFDEAVYVPGYRVSLVDTVGAGDAFSAGFLHCLLRQKSLAEACQLGNILGALAAATAGGTTPVSSHQIEGLRRAKTDRLCDTRLASFLVQM